MEEYLIVRRYKTYANLLNDWRLPMTSYWREQTIRRLFRLVLEPENVPTPACTYLQFLPKADGSPYPVIDSLNPKMSETQNQPPLSSPVTSEVAHKMPESKIIVLGDANVGKTALITRVSSSSKMANFDVTDPCRS